LNAEPPYNTSNHGLDPHVRQAPPLRSQADKFSKPAEVVVCGVQDWDLEGQYDPAVPAFDLVIAPSRKGASIEIFEAGANRAEDLPRMSFFCEVSNGVPTLHVHSMDSSDVARTFYAQKDGSLLERPGDADVTLVHPHYRPPTDTPPHAGLPRESSGG